MRHINVPLTLVALALLAGCASGPAPPAYPAFVATDELPDLFLAALPGVRAKEFASDMRTRSASNRIDLPEAWSGSSGGAPGKALEIFVVSGELQLADLTLPAGGYAYIPPGSLGFKMQTDLGARLLYFLNDPAEHAKIRTAIILDSNLVDWQPTETSGVFSKDLRVDPGSGESTRLLRYEAGATIAWQSSSAALEGYLVSGRFRDSECVTGEPYTETYLPGGYFRRPAGAVHGGPAASAELESVWFLRRQRAASTRYDVSCAAE